MEDPKKNNHLDIELTSEIAQGVYANMAIITHSGSEFVLDFVHIMPGMPKAAVKSRIILAPEHAKRLLLALDDNVKKYEKTHGQIAMHGGGNNDPMMPPMGFGTPTAKA
ncbi:MAG: DUF3467 domain-containing protein [Bacteroidales bacterium]|jgi:hypothetical protein|nr:DUF3467 domain-containing protein [Bacteroidales bacterium]